jgi:hypothetical protein
MSNEVQSPNAAGVKNAVEQSDNLALGMYAHQRKAAKAGVIGEPKISSEVINAKVVQPVTQQEVEENRSQEAPENETSNAPKAESVNESEQQPAEESDVLSKSSKEIDLESMSEQDLRELAEKLGSRAVARYGELTAKRRQAEEQLNALKQELVKRDTQKDPLETKKIENNPFGDIDTVEKLQAKAKEVDEAIEWAEDILWHNEHLGAEDIVATIDGKDYTKAQVRKVMRDSQKARKDFLPAQLAEVNARQNRVAVKQQFTEAIKTELNWMQGDDNDVRKQYEILKESPLLKKAMESVPDLEPYMEYMVAHAANSIYGRRPIVESKPSARLNPPSMQASSSAQSEQPETRAVKAVKDIQQRFSSSGATTDFIALRALQHSKRK